MDEFLKEFDEKVGSKYKYVSGYTGSKSKIKIIHKTCGYEYETTPHMLLGKKARRCPKCAGHIKWTEKVFQSKLKEKFGDEYSSLEKI